MKHPALSLKTLTLISLALASGPASLFAQSSTWNTTTTGASWDVDTNWAGNVIADGSGNTADFSQLDLPADTTVNVTVDRTIGNLIFGDTVTSSAASLTIAGGGGTLTLAGATPTITVNPVAGGKFGIITATMAGSSGFTKTGSGTLLLNNSINPLSGTVVIAQGNLQLNHSALKNASVDINAGSLIHATVGAAIGGTISFGGGFLQYNAIPNADYSSQFSTKAGQSFRISMAGSHSATYASALSSSGGTLAKLGTGTLTLAAANTFDGTTTVAAGNLILSNPLALQNSAIDTTNSAAGTSSQGLALSGVTAPVFGGLTGNKDLASIFNSTTGGYSGVINLTLNPGSGASNTYSGVIANGAAGMSLTKTGAGTQILIAANTYTGGTAINAGTLSIGNAAAFGSTGTISFGGGTLQYNGVTTDLSSRFSTGAGQSYQVDTNGQHVTWASALVSSGGSLTKSGAGTLTLAGGMANTFDGPVHVASGTLRTANGGSFKNITGDVTVANGATFDAVANFDGNTFDNDFFISGTGDGTYGALNISMNAVLTGTISLVADAKISHNYNNATVNGSITGTGTNLHLVTVDSGQGPLRINGPIQLGSGGVTVTGAGGASPVIINGNNTYTGNTTVTAGTLLLGHANSSIASSALTTVNTGAQLAGIGSVGALSIQTDAEVSPGLANSAAGNINITDGLAMAGILSWDLTTLSTASPGTNFDTLTVTSGDVDISGATLGLNLGDFAPSADPFWASNKTWSGIINNTGAGSIIGSFAAIDNSSWSSLGGFTTTISGNDVNLVWTAVPEPSSAVLALGLMSMALLRSPNRRVPSAAR